MRKSFWLAGLCVLGLASGAEAQTRRTVNPFWGTVDPTQLTYQPVNLSNSVVPTPTTQVRSSSFRLIDFFPRFRNSLSNRTTIGQSQVPTVKPGNDYLKSFGYIGPRPFGQ